MIEWLGSAFFDHLAGSVRAIGLAFFLAAFLTDQPPNLVISLIGLILIIAAPFFARTAARLARNEKEAGHDRDQ
jgi:hypothetical protein